jgi:peptidoglycan/xylan/chitin deacetylase (PgdA/CDA1 family)
MSYLFQSIKSIIKLPFQIFSAKFGRHTQKHKEPQLVILMYHRILPAEDIRAMVEEPGMTVSPDTFRMHLKLINEHFEIVSLSDWIKRAKNGEPLPENACAITFDDGWIDNYEFAYPALQAFSAPATIFLVSSMIGTEELFWPERLARITSEIATHCPERWSDNELEWVKMLNTDYGFSNILPTREQCSQIIAAAKVLNDLEIHKRLDRIEEMMNLNISKDQPSLLNWTHVDEMCSSGLIEFGSHSSRHIRLTDEISADDIKEEIINSKNDIKTNSSANVDMFCFPNGDYSQAAIELVKKNYLGAVTTQSGWNNRTTDPFLLNRISMHQDIASNRTQFLSRLSGWM